MFEPVADAEGLFEGVAAKGHDHHQVHVGIFRRLPVGVRAEEDDFLRLKFARDRLGVSLDGFAAVHFPA